MSPSLPRAQLRGAHERRIIPMKRTIRYPLPIFAAALLLAAPAVLQAVAAGADIAPSPHGAVDQEVLTLKIRFHITKSAKMTVKGQEMEVWVKPKDLEGVVLPEVNRIWKQAN